MMYPSHTYINSDVEKVRRFFTPELLHGIDDEITIAGHLENLANRLHEGIKEQEVAAGIMIHNCLPRFSGMPKDQVLSMKLDQVEPRECVAREYGWESWEQVEREGVFHFDLAFESAVDHLIYGRLEALRVLLKFIPSIITRRSMYGHRATLLHYVACNGTEIWRQVVPGNLPDMVELILSKGADKYSTIQVYNDHYSPVDLVKTSDHLANAGLVDELTKILS